MTFIRIGLPFVLFSSRKAGLSAKTRQETGACFSTFQAVAFGETEHR